MSRVARYHADRTNQKLYFARLACQQAEQIEHVQQAQAYREAAVFHLHGAVLAFLQESGALLSFKRPATDAQVD